MKVQNLFKYFLVVIFITGIPACSLNCDDDACECGNLGSSNPYYNVKVIGYDMVTEHVYHNYEWEPYNGEPNNAANRVRFTLDAIQNRYAEKTRTKSFKFNGIFTNTVYACSPVEPKPITSQNLISLTITSSADYDSIHPQGTDLKDLFTTYGTIEYQYDNIVPPRDSLTSYIDNHSKHFILYTAPIVLSKSPSNPSEHIFTFELELSDTIFTLNSPLMKLQ